MPEWNTTITSVASAVPEREALEIEQFLNTVQSATPFQATWFQRSIGGADSRHLVICRRNGSIMALGIGVVSGIAGARIQVFRGLDFQKGPIIKDISTARDVLHQMSSAARDAGFAYLLVQPQFENDDATAFSSLAIEAGWTREPGPSFATMKLDLRDGDVALLSRMKSDTRRRIKRAAEMGINVRFANVSDVPTIYALYTSTATRKGFSPLDVDSFDRVCGTILESSAVGCILVAELHHQLVGAIVVIRAGPTAHYVYGATDNRGSLRNLPIAYPLHHQATLWARRRGCTHYDMGGFDISRAISVSQFKAGFRGDLIRFPEQYSIYLVPLARHVRQIAHTLRANYSLLRSFKFRHDKATNNASHR